MGKAIRCERHRRAVSVLGVHAPTRHRRSDADGARMAMPHWMPGTSSRTYRNLRYLRGPTTYGADTERIWVRGQGFFPQVEWHHVTVWREREGWLVLQGAGFPPVLLPTAALQREDLYNVFKSLAQRHAVEYDGAAARRQAV